MNLKEFDAQLHDAEVKLKRLKALYEQWFAGIERLEPAIPKKDLERQLTLLRKEMPRNTAARFRFQQLQARYNTYLTYWGRIARQIEEGTYERDLRRARSRRHPNADSEERETKAFDVDLDQFENGPDGASLDDLLRDDEIANALAMLDERRKSQPPTAPTEPRRATFSAFSPFARPSTAPERTAAPPLSPPPPRPMPAPGAPAAKAPPPPPRPMSRAAGAMPAPPEPPALPRPTAAASPGNGDPAMRRIYDEYVAARKRANLGGKVVYDKLEASVQKMRSQLEKQHGKRVDFEVVLKDGKVGLKPKIGG